MAFVRETVGGKPYKPIEETVNTTPQLTDEEKAARAKAAQERVNDWENADAAEAQAEMDAYKEPEAAPPRDYAPVTPPRDYTPVTSQSVLDAQNYLSSLYGNKPAEWAGSSVDDTLKSIYDQIMSRPDFTYDLNGDALWQQYKEQYTMAGNMAMQDTMGQAAGLTGGYGSSYSQAVGQQSYNSYLQELNNIIPDLQDNAYGLYEAEGNKLQDQYALTEDIRNDEYAMYTDKYNQWQDEYDNAQDAVDTANKNQQTAKQNLIEIITSTGYTPTAEELSAAGMSSGEAAAWGDYYKSAAEAAAAETAAKTTAALETPTKDEKNMALYIYETEGPESLSKYIDSLPDIDAEELEDFALNYGDYNPNTGSLYEEVKQLMGSKSAGVPMVESEFNNSRAATNKFGTYPNYLDSLYQKYSK